VKAPIEAVWKSFVECETTKSEDVERLVRACLVYPDKAAFGSIMRELPGVLPACARAVSRLAGVREEALSGKS
jgi:hypothetical protein